MKKFFTNMTLQQVLQKYIYEARGNTKLAMDQPTSFPIIPTINGYVENGESFRVIVVVQDDAASERNFQSFLAELRELCERKDIPYTDKIVTRVPGPPTQTVSDNIDTAMSLIEYVEDDDELFACVTFGTKPMSMALLTAVRYANRIKENTVVSCIVYGEVDRRDPDKNKWKAYIYDETALLQLDELIRMLADHKVMDPNEILGFVLTGGKAFKDPESRIDPAPKIEH